MLSFRMTILLATNNPHKAEEIRAILSDIDGLTVLKPSDLKAPIPDPDEDGATLEENAYIKAGEIHEATGLPVVADDTGLEVAALNGEPGVYSARYAGPDATYEENCIALLDALGRTGTDDRSARFRTVICFTDGVRTLFAEGSVEGTILTESAGGGGFGYDPVFRPDGFDVTFAEMSAEEKNRISHRGRALQAFREQLDRILDDASGSD